MFEQLFKCPDALARQRPGPLVEERRCYLIHCAEQRMSTRTLRDVAIYTLAVARALRLADLPDELVRRAEIEAEANRWANRRPRPPMIRPTRLSRLRFAGQVSSAITNLYAEVDLEMKAKALANREVDGQVGGRPRREDSGLMDVLRAL
jgi:hypothetical protein